MAAFAYTDATLSIGGTDLSDHVVSLGLNVDGEELDITAMGDSWRDRIIGLKDWSIDVEFHQDFAASDTFWTLWNAHGTKPSTVVKPTSGAVSTTNPSFTGTPLINAFPILAGSVGSLSTISVSWNGGGSLAVATS